MLGEAVDRSIDITRRGVDATLETCLASRVDRSIDMGRRAAVRPMMTRWSWMAELSSEWSTFPAAGSRVVVTGAAGGLGSALTAALVKLGAEVVGIDRTHPEGEAASRLVVADLTDEQAASAAVTEAVGLLVRGRAGCLPRVERVRPRIDRVLVLDRSSGRPPWASLLRRGEGRGARPDPVAGRGVVRGRDPGERDRARVVRDAEGRGHAGIGAVSVAGLGADGAGGDLGEVVGSVLYLLSPAARLHDRSGSAPRWRRWADPRWLLPLIRFSARACCPADQYQERRMYYIGVDIGGTFTDCVLVDQNGNHRTAKALSTKDDPVSGVMTGLKRLAEAEGIDLRSLLARTSRFGHGNDHRHERGARARGRPGRVGRYGRARQRPDHDARVRAGGRPVDRGRVHGARQPAAGADHCAGRDPGGARADRRLGRGRGRTGH
ncbi:hypothetical protein L7F22_053655 [Adiantum nelumboides]|nr:hypothetical protein [Adiantum nelumboides]